jgi:succinate-acetate transporter protein
MLLGIAELGVNHAAGIKVAGGAFGLITAFNAWYVLPFLHFRLRS